jgi:hypothetical protein
VRNQQALHDTADRHLLWPDQQVNVVTHQAIAIQLEGMAFLEMGESVEKRLNIAGPVKDTLPIVATVDDVSRENDDPYFFILH